MQAKMKMHQMTAQEVDTFLEQADVGRVGTLGADGFPYLVPVHFAVVNGYIYFHGLNAGEKLENITRNAKVGFEADAMDSLRQGETACSTGTRYTSVIVKGEAVRVDAPAEIMAALGAIVEKYTPQHKGAAFSDADVRGIGVVRITVREKTGKRRV